MKDSGSEQLSITSILLQHVGAWSISWKALRIPGGVPVVEDYLI
jgi:hypothetical protein